MSTGSDTGVGGTDRRGLIWVALACLVATAPVWVASHPPMVDLPQHAAQVSLLHSMHDPHFRYGELFRVNWFTPYLLGYMLAYALLPVVGCGFAMKVVVAAALAAVPLLTGLTLGELGGRPRWALLAIPAMYGFAFNWGLLNYLVAAPVGIAFLLFAIKHTKKTRIGTSVGLAIFAVCLFFCHVLICGFLVAICAIYIVFDSPSFKAGVLRALPLAVIVPLVLFWFGTNQPSEFSKSFITVWDLGWFKTVEPYYFQIGGAWGRLNGFMPRLFGVEPGLEVNLFGALLFAVPWLAGCRPNRKWTAWVPFIACLLVLFAAPSLIFATDFVYQRFVVFVIPFYLLGMTGGSKAEPKPLMTALAPLLALVWVGLITMRMLAFNAEAKGFDEMADRMAPGERAVSMVFLPRSEVSIAPVFVHYPQWYAARRGGVVDPGFSIFDPELVVYRKGQIPPVMIGFEWEPGSFDWNTHRGDDYRYFMVRAKQEPGGYLFRTAPCAVQLRFHEGLWWLYEKSDACPSGTTP